LSEALSCLENDYGFLLQGDVFTEDLVAHWIRARRQDDMEVSIRPHPFEMDLYFDL
jgi:glutamine synthetase